jgi:hypothetical protein
VKRFSIIAAVLVMALASSATALATGDGKGKGEGHTPVTICHKPGTPAEQELVVDDDAVPGHLGHGDTLGPCEQDPDPEPQGECPEGTQQIDEDPLVCLKTVTNTVTRTIVREVEVTKEVPGPERIVERIVEVKVPVVTVKTKIKRVVKTKIKRVKVVKVRWKIKRVVIRPDKKKTTIALCRMSNGKVAVRGAG